MAEFNDAGFDKSNETGKLGERWFHKYLNMNGYGTVDVSDDILFRIADVDLIVAKRKSIKVDKTTKDEIKKHMESTGKFAYDKEKYCLMEVKTDCYCGRMCKENKPCNYYAEYVAHYSAGCFGVTRADKWAYIAWDQTNGVPLRLWIVDIMSLRKEIVSENIKPFSNGVYPYCSKTSKNGDDPGMFAWKIPMDYLLELGVAVEWSVNSPLQKITKKAE